jgi:hypothetical protein
LSFDYKEVLIMLNTLSLVSEMIRIANELDDHGFAEKADQVEEIAKKPHWPRFLKPQEAQVHYHITPLSFGGTHTSIKISAKSQEELKKAVQKYLNDYHPLAYGTTVTDRGQDEEGNFFVNIRRYPTAD